MIFFIQFVLSLSKIIAGFRAIYQNWNSKFGDIILAFNARTVHRFHKESLTEDKDHRQRCHGHNQNCPVGTNACRCVRVLEIANSAGRSQQIKRHHKRSIGQVCGHRTDERIVPIVNHRQQRNGCQNRSDIGKHNLQVDLPGPQPSSLAASSRSLGIPEKNCINRKMKIPELKPAPNKAGTK